MKPYIFGALVALTLVGCKSDTDIIKNSTLSLDNTTTIGRVFTNWSSCKSKKWDAFEINAESRIVEFSCNHNIKPYMDKFISMVSEKNRDNAAFDIDSIKQTFQFTLNKDDSFVPSKVTMTTVFADGTSFDEVQEPNKALKTAYNNELMFNVASLNKITAPLQEVKLTVQKVQSK